MSNESPYKRHQEQYKLTPPADFQTQPFLETIT